MLATQTLITKRSKNMRIKVDGQLPPGVSSKDIILYVIGKIGTAGGTSAVIEYCGSAIEGLSMEGRMSIVRSSYFRSQSTSSSSVLCHAIPFMKNSTVRYLL